MKSWTHHYNMDSRFYWRLKTICLLIFGLRKSLEVSSKYYLMYKYVCINLISLKLFKKNPETKLFRFCVSTLKLVISYQSSFVFTLHHKWSWGLMEKRNLNSINNHQSLSTLYSKLGLMELMWTTLLLGIISNRDGISIRKNITVFLIIIR